MQYQHKLQTFLTNNQEKKIIVIYGPTACGKTSLSIELAKQLDSEIISTDSRQIFTDLDIGTGKVTEEEKQGIVHHMLDILPPNQKYSVGEFKRAAQKIIENIWKQGKIPILCGGTGLYIDSLIYDFNIPKVPADEKLRERLEQQRIEKGNEYIWQKLQDIDPEYAKELHPNNHRYVIRALEVKLLTGKSKTEFREEKELKYDTLFLTPYDGNREKLYERINLRVEQMFDEGLVDEVKNIEKKYGTLDFLKKTIGYKEVIPYIHGEQDLETTIDLVQQHNRNYAKRQLTWFRRYEEKT